MTGGGPQGVQPTLDAADLLQAMPGVGALAELETHSPMRVASATLKPSDLIGVAELLESRFARDLDGAVVIQGTDTIEESAWLLDLLVRSDKPVVVTGAMRGAQAVGADGPANLLAAILVAASPLAGGRGTLVVLNDEIHAARWVQKSHTAQPSAFASPTLGPIGYVVEGEPTFHSRLARTPQVPVPALGAQVDVPPVALLRIAMGDDGRLLDAMPGLGFKGVVIEGAGAGHVPAPIVANVEALATEMPVVLASRVPAGPVFTRTYGYPGSEIDLIRAGVWPAMALSGLKARLLLGLLLRCDSEREVMAAAFGALATTG